MEWLMLKRQKKGLIILWPILDTPPFRDGYQIRLPYIIWYNYMYLSIHPSIYLSIYLSIYPSIYIYIYIRTNIHIYIYIYTYENRIKIVLITCQAIALLRGAWVVDADGSITLALGARRCHHLRCNGWESHGKSPTRKDVPCVIVCY